MSTLRANRKNSRKDSRKNSRKNSRKDSRKNSRKNTRKNSRHGGARSNRGVFSTLFKPVSGVVRTAGNVAHSGLNTAYAVPATFAKGAKNTVRNSLNRLVHGVDNIGKKAFSGVNRSISSVFKGRKDRKNRRSTRRSN
jgi:hypothetical protein